MRPVGRLHAVRTQSLDRSVSKLEALSSALLAHVVKDLFAIILAHEVKCQLEVVGELYFEWVKLHAVLNILRAGRNVANFFSDDEDLAQSDVEELLIEVVPSEQHQILLVVGYPSFPWDASALRNRVANDLRD